MRKSLILFLLLSLEAFAKSGKPDVYVTTIWKFKPDVSFEQAKMACEGLNAPLKKSKGFEKRNLFFDSSQNIWIDQIKWKHADVASGGMKNLEKENAYAALSKLIDDKSVQKFSGERILEIEAPQ